MLLKVLTSRQLSEWMAFAELEPFGERNRDLSIGLLTSLLANIHRDSDKKSDPFLPDDYMPLSAEKRILEAREIKVKDDEEKNSMVKAVFQSLNRRCRIARAAPSAGIAHQTAQASPAGRSNCR